MNRRHQREQEEAREEFNRILPSELDQLRADMKDKTQVRMNGRLQSRFYQVMFDRDILKLLDTGDVSVRNPFEYTRMNRANSMIEAADAKEQDSFFAAYPEEKQKWLQKIQEMFKDVRLVKKRV